MNKFIKTIKYTIAIIAAIATTCFGLLFTLFGLIIKLPFLLVILLGSAFVITGITAVIKVLHEMVVLRNES